MKTTATRLLAGLSCLFAMLFTVSLARGASHIQALPTSVSESNAFAIVTLQRSGDLDTTVSVDYFTAPVTAQPSTDYVATNGTATFTAGVSNLTVAVALVNDALPESSQYFNLYLTNATGGATLNYSPPSITILDNDSGIQMQSVNYTNREDSVSVTVTVTRGVDENFPASVTFYTQDSSARAGTDYVATNGTIEFAEGEFAKTVTIPILNDTLPENYEMFLFRLGTVTGATALGSNTIARIYITNDDVGILVEKKTYWVRYDAGSMTIGVLAGVELDAPATVEFYTTNGTALAGVDYVATNGILNFAPGQLYQTVTVAILDDGVRTANKSFDFRLGAVTGPTGLGSNKVATITILEANNLILTGDRRDFSLAEGNSTSFLIGGTLGYVGADGGGRNVFLVFEMPHLAANERILSAQLSFYLNGTSGSPSFNGDLWGIAFQTNKTPTQYPLEFLESDSDETPTGAGNVKLQDNILFPGMAAGNVTSSPDSGLAAYLQGFYDNNPDYVGGLYVFLRLNPDADAGDGTIRYSIALTESGNVPMLALTTSGTTPTIYRQPPDQAASLGGSVTNTVLVGGGVSPYDYQWYFNGTLMPGMNGPSLALQNIQTNSAGLYSVVVHSADNYYVTSRVARLVVDATFTTITTGAIMSGVGNNWMAAWADFDGDGYDDVFVVGTFDAPSQNKLFRNNRDGTFAQVTTGPLGNITTPLAYVAWGDYNNDGNIDLLAGAIETRSVILYINQGGGSFIATNLALNPITRGADVRGQTVAWGDYNNDGYLDIAVAWYQLEGAPNPVPDMLLLNMRDGTFQAVTNTPFNRWNTTEDTLSWVDVDNDGDLDLFACIVDSPTSTNVLWTNLGGGVFQQGGSGDLFTIRGQCIADFWGDYDNDGDLDVFVTWTFNSNDKRCLFRNDGNGVFTHVPGPFDNVFLEGGSWVDYDNDGFLDLFCTGLNYESRLYRNEGNGTFVEVQCGSLSSDLGRAWFTALSDYDRNGFVDFYVINQNNATRLYRNNGNSNHWLQVRLVGTASNRSGIGAKVRVKSTIGGNSFWQMRPITAQSLSQELTACFGLGNATNIEVLRIEWPSGIVQELTNVVANQFLTVTEPPKCVMPCVKSGQFEITVTGNIGTTYQLLGNDVVCNYTNWTVLQTITLTNRTQVISVPVLPSTNMFYQLRLVP